MRQIKTSQAIATILFLTIVSSGFFLRIYNLNFDNFWVDEIFSFWVADPSISLKETFSRNNQIEIVPILFNLILKFFFKIFGYNVDIARFVSLFFGFLSIVLVCKLYTNITKNKNNLLIAFLLSFNIFLIGYSQELRVYSLIFFLVSINLIYFVKIVEDNKLNILNIIIFVLINYFSMLAHQFTLIIICSYIFFIFISHFQYKKNFYNLNISVLILSIISIIYLYIFYKNQLNYMFWVKQIDLKFFTNFYFSKFFGSRLIGLIHLFLFFYLIFVNKKNIFKKFNIKLILYIIIFFSYFLPIVYGYIFEPILNARYIIFVLIPILIITCDLIYKFKNLKIKNILILFLFLITFANHFTEDTFMQFSKERRIYKPDFSNALNEIERSDSSKVFIKVERADLNVKNPIEPQIKSLENYVYNLSKKKNITLEFIDYEKGNIYDNFWIICVVDLNNDCNKPKNLNGFETMKDLDLNRLNIKYLEKK